MSGYSSSVRVIYAALICSLLLSAPALAKHGASATSWSVARIPSRQPVTDSPRKRDIAAMFRRAGVPYPAPVLFLRGFKKEGRLELWAGRRNQRLRLIRSYPICAKSGQLGPKRREGDLQVPEGFYRISYLNRHSSYHRALKVSYPNRSDRILGYRPSLGGAIMIHGACVTIGCLPLRDGPIEQLFNIVDASRRRFHRLPAVHLFPTRLDDAGMRLLVHQAKHRPKLLAFWRNLRVGYAAFERSRKIPRIGVDDQGRYRLR